MGRLKKDHDGWKSAGLWLKYQYPKIEEEPRTTHKKKNTRKWCKGRKGVEHDYELVEKHKFLDWSWKIYKCINCGKQKYR